MENLKGILGRLLESSPGYQRLEKRSAVLAAWPEIVGERAAAHCEALAFFEDGILLIGADHSAWLTSLRYLEPQILSKFEKKLGRKLVTGLRYKIKS